MGTSHWSNDFYRDRAEHRAATNANLFDYHAKTAAQPVHERKVHDLMNPKGVPRESRDSDAHPNSVAIAVILGAITIWNMRSVSGLAAKLDEQPDQ